MKDRKVFGHKLWCLWIMGLFFFMLGIEKGMCYDSWNASWNQFKWNPVDGTIDVRFRYYQTWGGSGNGDCGFSSGVNITVGSYVIYLKTKEDWDNGNCLVEKNLPKGVTFVGLEHVPLSNGEHEAYINFKVPVDQNYLNTRVSYSIVGTWWRRWAAAVDQNINYSNTIETPVSRSPFVNGGYRFGEHMGKPAVFLRWERPTQSGNNANHLGNIELADRNKKILQAGVDEVVSFDGNYTGGEMIVSPSGGNYSPDNASAYVYHLVQRYVPTYNTGVVYETSTTESEAFRIPSYTQVSGLKAEVDGSSRTIVLRWTMPASPVGNGEYVSDQFRINYQFQADPASSTPSDEGYVQVDYEPGRQQYEYPFELEEGTKGNFKFEIYRTYTDPDDAVPSIWRKTYRKEIEVTDVNYNHLKAENLVARFNDEGSGVILTWDVSGSVWSNGTQVVISRINHTTGVVDPINLSKSDLLKDSYEDLDIRLCNAYQYKMAITPNDEYGRIEPIYTDINHLLVMSDKGHLLSFDASKGYFSDRVELTWSKEGIFDQYSIERKEYAQADSYYKKILTENNVSTSDDYIVYDNTAEPGKVYSYRLIGLTNCADSVLVSDEILSEIGFRTPTGDIYGRVTFSNNGQAVDSVEVYLESEIGEMGQSLYFDGNSAYAQVDDSVFLGNVVDSVTIQAWVRLDDNTGGECQVISKKDMYELGINSDHKIYFRVGNHGDEVVSSQEIGNGMSYFHVTVVKTLDELKLYINGRKDATSPYTGGKVTTGRSNPLVMGGGTFKGWIDEVRVWNRGLGDNEIVNDYNRYLVGNEDGLLAYYTFNYVVSDAFYDISYDKLSVYNQKHGKLYGAVISNDIPSTSQLGYRAYTGPDGNYAIRAVPYVGKGTAYTIIPKLGVHVFDPQSYVKMIGLGAESHTVNFEDISSFDLPITVVYQGGTYPVKGVQFKIDGVPAMDSKGNTFQTDANGEVTIQVPVGTHEVKAFMDGHTFAYDGRICNSDLSDINYQDNMSRRTIEDMTRVKYIGRIGGGVVQDSYPVGFGLSKNNLADNMRVTLTHSFAGSTYDMVLEDTVMEFAHEVVGKEGQGPTNKVTYTEDGVIIDVNNETGEFVAWLRPEEYKLKLSVTGHTAVPGDNSVLDLKQAFAVNYESYEYSGNRISVTADTVYTYDYEHPLLAGNGDTLGYRVVDTSVLVSRDTVFGLFKDSVMYNVKQKFIERVRPEVDIVQLVDYKPVDYFGNEEYVRESLVGKNDTVKVVNQDRNGSEKYLFGKPLFVQGQGYTFAVNVFEGYRYNGKDDRIDRVATQDATISFENNIAGSDSVLTVDSLGYVEYTFYAGNPVLDANGLNISAKVTIGGNSGSTQVSFPWNPPSHFASGRAFVIGGKNTGTSFVTGGPDRILTVLRDPPGSNSYSFLEKGVTFESISEYTGSLMNQGEEWVTVGARAAVYSWQGVGAGTMIETTEAESGTTVSFIHEESYVGHNAKRSKMTTTTRFQTGSTPEYVGADGDLYIGYATNLTFGRTNNVVVESRENYEQMNGEGYGNVYVDAGDWMLVQKDGTSISQQFSTLFAYPQRFLVQTMIPSLEKMKLSYLQPMPQDTLELKALQAIANQKDTVFYLSYFDPTHPDYGKSNTDESITDKSHGVAGSIIDGPSYKVIFKNDVEVAPNSIVPVPDTINFINQSIAAWKKVIAENEKAKLDAELMQNYSFHAGADVSYSEAYSASRSHESTYDIVVGANMKSNVAVLGLGIINVLEFKENLVTSQGEATGSSAEKNHVKGFVFSEDGIDYLSVDVCREANEDDGYDNGTISGNVSEGEIGEPGYYSSFVFRTKGGETSCPYEGERVTLFYNPGTVLDAATMRMENPMISADKYVLENVPSGEPARFTIYVKNESESDITTWFNLRVLDRSNPHGAKVQMDGNALGTGRKIMVNREPIAKTIEVYKGSVLDYENLQLVLESECQPSGDADLFEDIADTLTFSVYFTKSCTDVEILQPSDNWTYNTALDTTTLNGIPGVHYMPVVLGGFDVNYSDFDHIEIQYKPASGSDDDYVTLASFYNDSALYKKAVEDGKTARMIQSSDGGKIMYNWFMDDLFDQQYDLRAVSVCNIANELIYNYSQPKRGLKDMYRPRLFGSPQPADGILSVEDEIRLNFNEPIAGGYITKNNFQVTGIRNGSESDHGVSVQFDGIDDYLYSEVVRNLTAKDFTVEMWINGNLQDAVLFSHGDVNNYFSLGMTSDGRLFVEVNGQKVTSETTFNFDQGSWAHVAAVYSAQGRVWLYYNYDEILSGYVVGEYNGIGNFMVGTDIGHQDFYSGKLHNLRVWEKIRTRSEIQLNSNVTMSGNDVGLMLYCPMDEGRGSVVQDKARAAHLVMNGCQWAVPDGRSTQFDGVSSYVVANSASAVVLPDMDFTIEFWFKAAEGSRSVTMLSNGLAEGDEVGGSSHTFRIGFDASGKLYFLNNGNMLAVEGDYADNQWHHMAVTVGRVQGFAQIYMDGKLSVYGNANSFKGIEGISLYMGVCGWYESGNSHDLQLDGLFKGSLDEVRLWNLYKNSELVEEGMYRKLDGKELGLLLYYPFEYYKEFQGSSELSYTLADMKVPEDPSQPRLTATAIGQVSENADIPPVVDKGPVSNLEFSYVVNNDALIITLEEPYSSIERTIVTFTVDDILDVNGNPMLQPVSWTAYIDRNQLKWSQDEWVDSKAEYEPYSFTVDIVNKGGSALNYQIWNMPSWLLVEPVQGKIGPSSTRHINFTVSEDLNVGNYKEVIYLTNESMGSEPLSIDLTVKGETPQWEVNPEDYRYSMSIFGKMRFNNIFSDDENDMLAVFQGNRCVGVAHSMYNRQLDMWYAMLTVFSNGVVASDLTFRMWDASTGTVYQAQPSQPITFRNDYIYGTPSDPILFDGKTMIYQDIHLEKGWNWVSFNLDNPNMTDLDKALYTGKWKGGDQIKTLRLREDGTTQACFADYSEQMKGWQNASFGLNNTNMFMIYSSQAQTLSMDGVAVDPMSIPITLKSGFWNYISYLPGKNLPVKSALAGYEAEDGDVVKSVDKFAMYHKNNWVGSLEYMEPNHGYMLLNTSSKDKTLVYPTVASMFRKKDSYPLAQEYPHTMSVIASGKKIGDGDALYAMVKGEPRGKATRIDLTHRKSVYFIPIGAYVAGEEISFRLTKPDGSEYRSVNRMEYVPNGVIGNPDKPYMIVFEEVAPDEGNRWSVVPNPASDRTTVTGWLAAPALVSLYLSDISGVEVYRSEPVFAEAGVFRQELDLQGLASGVYLVNMVVDGQVRVSLRLIRK